MSLNRPNTTSSLLTSLTASLNDQKHHLLLAASGSVAIVKLVSIINALRSHTNLSIRIILTQSARRFFQGQSGELPILATLEALPNVDAIYQDEDEWHEPWTRESDILHIQLRRWADLLMVAPLSANTLAKIANGLSDNLLMSVIRAWDVSPRSNGRRANIIVAPAMNTCMWAHPVTARHIRVLQEDWGANGNDESWFVVMQPQVKLLACGDLGAGAMCEWKEIVVEIEQRLGLVKR